MAYSWSLSSGRFIHLNGTSGRVILQFVNNAIALYAPFRGNPAAVGPKHGASRNTRIDVKFLSVLRNPASCLPNMQKLRQHVFVKLDARVQGKQYLERNLYREIIGARNLAKCVSSDHRSYRHWDVRWCGTPHSTRRHIWLWSPE